MFSPKFIPERDKPDLSGKITLVTGGNTGIGYETVKQLLLKNAKVYLTARSPENAAAAIKRLEEETKQTAIFLQLDLADLPSVRKAAETFLAQESRLDVLFNNIPTLTKSYEETKVPARIINTSSIGHQMAPGNGIEFVSLKGGPERDAWVQEASWVPGAHPLPVSHSPHPLSTAVDRRRLYGESKIGNIFISNYFAKKYSDVLVSCALHPGGIKTELPRHAPGWQQVIGNFFLYPAPMGAYTQLWGATVARPAQITGQGKLGKADKRASSAKMRDEVIAYIKEQVKDF
ncbi:hypothetical protein B0H10DRAFT_2224865 [Mycena sp. CBHHK59/15]|nr:hypothetical protein B0H10DRAFT_2224865 [Mycena sp. CBHHK59/15]